MSTFAEYTKKKKKKAVENTSFREYTKSVLGDAFEDDIAPVRTTGGGGKRRETTANKKEKERKWFESGAFSDGYQFGDVTKTILGTITDVDENVTQGILGIGEGTVDAGAWVVGKAGGLFGADNFEKKMGDFIAKDLIDEEKLSKNVNILGTGVAKPALNRLDGWDTDEMSVFGEKTDSLVQSGGQLAGTAVLQAAGLPWFVTTGVTSFGSQTEQALNEGASFNQAGGSALISAGAEVLSEKISGGIKFGGKTLDDVWLKPLTQKISNKVLRTLTNVGMDAAGEGFEEVFSSTLSRLGTKLYKEESVNELLLSEEAMDEYLESFIGGAVLGGGMGGVNAARSLASGRDYKTGLTDTEQMVIDKEVKNRIAEEETDGKKLTGKEKKAIEDQVKNDFEKGYISTDTIESVIGGDTYRNYKSITNMEETLKDEIKRLENDPRPFAQNRVEEARNQLKQLEESAKKAELKDLLSNKVEVLTRGSRLGESYREIERRSQRFEANLTKYDEKTKATIQRAIDSGILNNTNRTHEFVDMIAKVSADKGVSFDFTDNENLKKSGFALEGKTVNGLVKDGNIILNIDSAKALNTVVGHEITHVLEGTELYAELQKAVKDYATTKGDYEARFQALSKLYEGVDGAEIETEITADLVGDYLFTDADFVTNLHAQKPNVFKKIFEEIKYLCKIATAGSKEARQLEKVRRTFEKAYRDAEIEVEAQELSDTDVKFSIREEAPPKNTDIAYKVFYVKDGKLYPPMVANPDGEDTPMGVWLNADVGTSAPPSKTGRAQVKAGGKGTQGGSGSLAFRPGWHLGDLPRASQFDRVNPETGKKELFPENFVWAEVEYAKDVDYQEEAMSYGYTENGKFRHSYAGLPRLPENGYYRYRTNPNPDTVPWVITGAMKVNRLLSDAEVNEILEKNGVAPVHRQGGDVGLDKFGFREEGNVKYSLAESDHDYLDAVNRGDTETAQKMVDDAAKNAGYTIRSYHGTLAKDFTEFKKEYIGSRFSYDDKGFFFIDNKKIAEEYSQNADYSERGRVLDVYLKVAKPLIVDEQFVLTEGLGNIFKENDAVDAWDIYSDFFKEEADNRKADGIIINDGESKMTVVFSPRQIKSAELATYDNYGNVIPLSRRFGIRSDIRYSLADSDGKQLTKEQQEFFKDSKVRDENGNLKVMYHGTEDGGFHKFNPAFSSYDAGMFFVDDNVVAKSYSGTHETYAAKTLNTVEDLNSFFAEINATEYEAVAEDGKYVLYEDGDEIAVSDTVPGLFEEYRDWSGNGYGGVNYKVYLNLKNPLIVDAKGNNWNEISSEFSKEVYDKYNSLTDAEKKALIDVAEWDDIGIFRDELEQAKPTAQDEHYRNLASAYEKMGGEDIDFYGLFDAATEGFSEEAVRKNAIQFLKTRDYAHIAKEKGHDGVIFKNIVDNGLYASGMDRFLSSTVAIAFDSNQIKSVENAKPTSNPDIRFSLSETVEESKDLIAIHNLSGEKLAKSLKMGGLPMPSIAIARAQDGHTEFGEISLILAKEAIDPKISRRNKVYSGDAWTPTYPTVEYKADETVRRRVETKIRNLVPYEVQNELGNVMLDSDNMRDTLNRYDGDMVDAFKGNDSMKYAYLLDNGVDVKLPMKEADLYRYGKASNAAVRYFAGKLVNGLQTVEHYQNMGARDMLQDKELAEAVTDAQNFDVLRTLEPGSAEYLEYERNPVFRADEVAFRDIDGFLSAARKLLSKGVQQTVDRKAAKELIRDTVDQTEYESWLKEQFSGIVEKEGIRNNQGLFTRSGNRRSFEALHYEHNLENVVKAMLEKGDKGIGAFGGGNIFGASAKEFSSIEELKKSKGRLANLPEEEFSEIKKQFSERFLEIARSFPNDKKSFVATDDAANMLIEAVSKYSTRNGIANYVRKESQGWATYSEQAVDDLIELVNDIRNMPTGYFEAKPQRAVGFDEVGVFVIPNNADVKLKQELLNRGYSIAEYDPDVEGSRQKVVNSFEEYKFSLSDAGANPKNHGNFNIYAKDIRYNAPETAVENDGTVPFAEDYAPMAEVDAYIRDAQQENTAYFPEDMAPEAEEVYNGTFADHPTPPNVFADRNIEEMGDRSIKAYMYENPEVKPYFQEEARYMLGELDNSSKGEKFYNDQLYYDTNGEMGFFGTKRHTSDDIAYLLDSFGYTYKDIAKGLNAIIEDNGKENNAISKRIEFLLDERLRLGYRDFWLGDQVPPNQDYINLLNEKQITDYSDESWNYWLQNLSEDDLNSLRPAPEIAPAPAEYIPAEPEYAAIRPKPEKAEKEPRMVRVETAEKAAQKPAEPIAKVLTEEPAPEKKKSRFWSQAAELTLDKGFVFENLSKKTKNRELEAKWNYIRYADSKAQDFIGKGAEGVKSLNDIKKDVENAGLTQEVYEYVYHLHNIDRMSLADRYENVPNKAVFGDSVTPDVSRKIVAELEAKHPEVKKFANEIYSVNNYLRNLLVEGGVISQETADLWAEMYPHYVPIRRAGDHGLNINVPLDTGRTGINAPVKRATGGSSDILPLFDTMAQRALQTYKAVAKNSFGVELKNALGTTVGTETADVDSVIDGLDQSEELLQKGKNGRKPTFTVFEGGEKVTFEITEDMYDALKPTNETLAYTNKVANTISNLHRGVLTEYNPAFLASNIIKDVQDVLINSQHPAKTYANFPKAIKEMTANGKWYKEYLKNGGEQNSYFDKKTNTFAKDKSTFTKVVGMPLNAISVANNFIERLPRLAEYIASREAGRSIEVSMLDSARVTTNFAAGGDLTKFLNRNGATFLNASVQGAMQQVRNVREAKMNGLKGWTQLAAKYAIAGLPAVLLNSLLWDDDEEYKELSDYVKQNYYVVAKYGDGKFVRIPKGRTLAIIQDALQQTINAATGNDEADLQSFLKLAVSNLAPNNPIEDNILAPVIQAKNNTTWYGDDLVPTRLQDLPAAEQFDETTDSISRWLGEKLNVSPYKINYLLDQYTGVVGDTVLPILTPEAESGEDSTAGKLLAPIRDKFTTDSVLKNQNVSDFYDTSDTLTTNAKASGATDKDVLSNKYINAVKTEIGELYAEKRAIQSGNLSDSEKYYLVREIQKKINSLTENALSEYENVNIDGEYATVGDRQYRKTDTGWTKITDEQLEKQDEVTSGLGITPAEYWSDKDEYDFAYDYSEKYSFFQQNGITYDDYKSADEDGKRALTWASENPGKYTMSKAITDDYMTYYQYKSELSDIRADKDADGKSIAGSAKEKKIDYINNLDLDYGQRLILYRSLYDSDKDKQAYNGEILDYLNSRMDLTTDEIITILEELDFKVYDDGRVEW